MLLPYRLALGEVDPTVRTLLHEYLCAQPKLKPLTFKVDARAQRQLIGQHQLNRFLTC